MGDAIPYGFLKKLRIRNIIVREFLAEFLGTFILIIFGDAAFAQAVLEERKVADDVFAVTWAWGVAVMLGVATCANVSDAPWGSHSLLMFTALACIDTKNLNMPKWTHPFILGFMISALAMCFGANCMAPLNPARDFATRCSLRFGNEVKFS
ncbi:Aquaporin-10 like protein [Argiope bruennichi]|uniref:Aquaporin-10 like protein n=1 Tax=Argiope bruennichi TaxID=94029 RepID=A0A8T0EFV1_ARGBR|nr:Aquaporin-10 like protein [Argiope bruennichi]